MELNVVATFFPAFSIHAKAPSNRTGLLCMSPSLFSTFVVNRTSQTLSKRNDLIYLLAGRPGNVERIENERQDGEYRYHDEHPEYPPEHMSPS